MKRFCIFSYWSHLINVLTFFPQTGGCSEGLGAFRFFFKNMVGISSRGLEGFNDWGGRGYDDFVSGEVTRTAPSGDETT